MARSAVALLAALGMTAALAAMPAQAQPGPPSADQDRASDLAAARPCCVVPAGTPVAVEMAQTVSTRTAKAGDAFDIRLAAPLIVDGRVVLPQGTPGVGRVVQSSGPGIGGKGAKLILSAEYLNAPGGAVKLSAMQLTGTGKDHSNAANMLGVGGLVFMPLGLAGIVMTGEAIEIPSGVVAAAKIADDVTLQQVAMASGEDYQRVQAVFGQPATSTGWLNVPPPPAGLGQVVFFRRKTMVGIQWFNVRENGDALGKLTTGTYFIVPLAPGLHSFTAKSEPELKDHLTLKIDPGETYYVESIMTHGLVLGAAELTPSDKARFDQVSGDLKPAEVKTADAGR